MGQLVAISGGALARGLALELLRQADNDVDLVRPPKLGPNRTKPPARPSFAAPLIRSLHAASPLETTSQKQHIRSQAASMFFK